MQDFVDRNRANAATASRAQSRLKAIEKMERIDAPADRRLDHADQAPRAAAERPGRRQARGRRRSPTARRSSTRGLDLEIERGDKVVLVGPNGAGKTTLMKILAGILDPTRGEDALGSNVFATYFAQHRVEALDMKSTVLASLREVHPGASEGMLRHMLGAFLFSGEAVDKPVSRPLRRREDPALPGEDPHRRPQLHHDGRADQPPRHRQPRRPRRGPSGLPGHALLHLPRRALHPRRRQQGHRGRVAAS